MPDLGAFFRASGLLGIAMAVVFVIVAIFAICLPRLIGRRWVGRAFVAAALLPLALGLVGMTLGYARVRLVTRLANEHQPPVPAAEVMRLAETGRADARTIAWTGLTGSALLLGVGATGMAVARLRK